MTRARDGILRVVGRMTVYPLNILSVEVVKKMDQRQRTLWRESTVLIESFGVLLGGARIPSGSRKVLVEMHPGSLDVIFLYICPKPCWSNSPSKIAETFQV